MESREIQRYLLHRYPMLMIDRVLELEHARRAVGIKQVSANEWFFQGHFPGNPVFPGVLIIEALAQLAAVANTCPDLGGEQPATQPLMGYLAGVKEFKFLKPVVPGDTLWLSVTFLRRFGRIYLVDGEARVNESLVAKGMLLFAVVEET